MLGALISRWCGRLSGKPDGETVKNIDLLLVCTHSIARIGSVGSCFCTERRSNLGTSKN